MQSMWCYFNILYRLYSPEKLTNWAHSLIAECRNKFDSPINTRFINLLQFLYDYTACDDAHNASSSNRITLSDLCTTICNIWSRLYIRASDGGFLVAAGFRHLLAQSGCRRLRHLFVYLRNASHKPQKIRFSSSPHRSTWGVSVPSLTFITFVAHLFK